MGIELLDGLYNKSLELAQAYSKSGWVSERRVEGKNCAELTFLKDDFIRNYEEWVSRASVVFANATCFEPDMLE